MSGRHALPRESGPIPVMERSTRTGPIQIRPVGRHARPAMAIARDIVAAAVLLLLDSAVALVAILRIVAGDWQHIASISFAVAAIAGCGLYLLLRGRGRTTQQGPQRGTAAPEGA